MQPNDGRNSTKPLNGQCSHTQFKFDPIVVIAEGKNLRLVGTLFSAATFDPSMGGTTREGSSLMVPVSNDRSFEVALTAGTT